MYSGHKSFIRNLIFRYFFSVGGFLFILLDRVFQGAETLVKSSLSFFLSWLVFLCWHLRNLCVNQGCEDLLLHLLFKVCMILLLVPSLIQNFI